METGEAERREVDGDNAKEVVASGRASLGQRRNGWMTYQPSNRFRHGPRIADFFCNSEEISEAYRDNPVRAQADMGRLNLNVTERSDSDSSKGWLDLEHSDSPKEHSDLDLSKVPLMASSLKEWNKMELAKIAARIARTGYSEEEKRKIYVKHCEGLAQAAIKGYNKRKGTCFVLVEPLLYRYNLRMDYYHVNFTAMLPEWDSPKCFFAEVKDEDNVSAFINLEEGDERGYCGFCLPENDIRHPINGFQYGVVSEDFKHRRLSNYDCTTVEGIFNFCQ